MFYIIELFSNDLMTLFNFIVETISTNCAIKILSKDIKENKLFVTTPDFRLNVYLDENRNLFDKEDFGIDINTVLWFDIIPNSNYEQIIIQLVKSLFKEYMCDMIMFNTEYDALFIRKKGKFEVSENNTSIISKLKKEIY